MSNKRKRSINNESIDEKNMINKFKKRFKKSNKMSHNQEKETKESNKSTESSSSTSNSKEEKQTEREIYIMPVEFVCYIKDFNLFYV
jgi:hypothetical protein